MMTPTELPPNIAALSIEDIASYLRHLGWKEVPYAYPNARLFHDPLYDFGNPFVLILPRSKSLIDASRRIRDVFDIHSARVEKTPDELADEIASFSRTNSPKPQPVVLSDKRSASVRPRIIRKTAARLKSATGRTELANAATKQSIV